MSRSETAKFEFRQYQAGSEIFENDLVAQLPGLLITQFSVPNGRPPGRGDDRYALRFDFIEDWYSVTAFLDEGKQPTGHYRVAIQSPLQDYDGIWKGYDLLLGLEILQNWDYFVTGEEDFCAAVEEGWMRVYSAANAREALRKLCNMLDEGCLPQEVMDAVGG